MENNSFLWLPFKTASTTLSWILAHYKFRHYCFKNGEYVLQRSMLTHLGHDLTLPPTHENMNLICATRHPYHRVLSFIKMLYQHAPETLTKEEFDRKAWEICFKENSILNLSAVALKTRTPNFAIRQEHLFEDLVKIPFIKDSKLNQCGILEEMCDEKINSSFDLDVDEYLSKELKDKIFDSFKEHFELFNYQR